MNAESLCCHLTQFGNIISFYHLIYIWHKEHAHSLYNLNRFFSESGVSNLGTTVSREGYDVSLKLTSNDRGRNYRLLEHTLVRGYVSLYIKTSYDD